MKTFLVLGLLVMSVTAQVPPDNSKINQRDRSEKAVTADEQGNSKEDLDRTAAIRKAIRDQKDLSTYANNIKVVTKNGVVTLRGPVRDANERTLIGKLATGVAGEKQVKNELEIAPTK